MRVALLGWMGAVALVAACSGASNPLGGKSNAQGDGGGGGSGGGSGGSSSSSGDGGSSSSGSSTSSTSSGGGATTCTNGSICNDGSAMQVCTTMGADGKCASIRYTVDSTSFTCDGCSDCTSAQAQASEACAEAGSSSSGGGSGGGSGSSSGSGSGSGSSSGSSSGGPVDAGDGDATCQAEVAASCVSCCQGLHATGVNELVADIQACDCGTSGACQTACASEYCADGTVSVTGDACDVCLQASVDPDGGACLSTLQTECAADADCLSYITCTNGCPAQ